MGNLARKRTSTNVQILDIAEDLAQIRGFNAFSYADISEAVGIRKASIHYHFPTKAHLGKALILRYSDRMQQSLERIQEEHSAPYDRLVAAVEVYEEMLGGDRLCLCTMLGAGIATMPSEFREGIASFFTNTATWLARVIKDGCEDGSFTCDSPEASAWVLLDGMLGVQALARACKWEPGQFKSTVIAGFIAPLQV